MDSATLYIVSGPIGHLDDITLRAIDVLKNVSLILSEDTRVTAKLLHKYAIKAEQLSYRDQNHAKALPQILARLQSGQNVALVSDSGTPLISDPGFKLVKEVKLAGFKVAPIPGASAVISALVSSGLPTDKFTFLGFLPKSSTARVNLLQEYGKLDSTLILFESPYRIGRLLSEIDTALGNRVICIAREITKVYEDFQTDYLTEIAEKLSTKKLRGECILLIAKQGYLYKNG